MHNLPKLLFDLVTGTFPDAMFQHNWWVILMAVATPHKRTPPGRRSKYTWLTFPKTVSVSRIQTTGLSSVPRNLLGKQSDMASSSSAKIERLRFLGLFREGFLAKKEPGFTKNLDMSGLQAIQLQEHIILLGEQRLEQIQINKHLEASTSQ